ncbi:MAG TPA: phosphatase PAP2 family protein [Oligoflexus sp.]|uniref:phosphatase PAP2 family protein n=1 Tax=Oligoflexus sp. TaxID=1971216 RepID=UPI002D7E213D|nr:phosphatase PAP2 family protein [Oligoflexus sp.]HET9236374.1 phosphatase PAP2 family protein [Oligoflexus sp.]
MLKTSYQTGRRILSWLREFDARLLLATLLTAASLFVFLEIADEVMEGETQSLDERIIVSLREPQDLNDPIGPLWLEGAVRDISALGSFVVLMLFVSFVMIFLILIRRYKASLFVLGAAGSGVLVSHSLKLFFSRPRPDIVSHGTNVLTYSFPSGHSMLSAVVYLTLGALLTELVTRKRLKSYFLLVGLFLSFIVGLSRIYLGVHYPSDVIAGWCAGLFWAALFTMIARIYTLRTKDPAASSRMPLSRQDEGPVF